MREEYRAPIAFSIMALLLTIVGFTQSWSVSLSIINLCIISSIMAIGVNLQWGFGGLFNAGVMGFTALGGLTAVLISHDPVHEAWDKAGVGIIISAIIFILSITLILYLYRSIKSSFLKNFSIILTVIVAFFGINNFYGPSVDIIESINPAKTGFLGGLGLPIVVSWLFAAGVAGSIAWIIGRITLKLRSDYLAIATLGISEIVIAVVKHEDWLSRGVKNVSGLDRPVPYEIELQQSEWFINIIESINYSNLSVVQSFSERQDLLSDLIIDGSGIFVKLCYTGLFASVLLLIFYLSQLALNAPWGRMLRAIRDNEEAASAMGKNIFSQHLQIFIIGSAIIGIAGAMLTTLDGQFTPGSYRPLRFTFIIWLMVIVGGSGNNLGSIFGGFFIWFIWIEAEPLSLGFVNLLASGLSYDNPLRMHLIGSAAHLRLFIMGLLLLLALRFMPKGVIPERIKRK
mgnify:FL=1